MVPVFYGASGDLREGGKGRGEGGRGAEGRGGRGRGKGK